MKTFFDLQSSGIKKERENKKNIIRSELSRLHVITHSLLIMCLTHVPKSMCNIAAYGKYAVNCFDIDASYCGGVRYHLVNKYLSTQ